GHRGSGRARHRRAGRPTARAGRGRAHPRRDRGLRRGHPSGPPPAPRGAGAGRLGRRAAEPGRGGEEPVAGGVEPVAGGVEVVAVVPSGLRYDAAAARLRALLAAGTRVGAVLVAGDEGVLVANRLPGGLPVIDQVDADAAAACRMLAVEGRPPGPTPRALAAPGRPCAP